MKLTDGIGNLPGIGKKWEEKLNRLEVKTVFDLLYHLPFRYEDRRIITPTSRVKVGSYAVISGSISKVINVITKNGKRMQVATVKDLSGSLAVIWFNQLYLARSILPESQITLYGRVNFFNHKPSLISPDFEFAPIDHSLHMGRIVPIYPETVGITSKWLRTKIYTLLNSDNIIFQFNQLKKETGFDLGAAFANIHFPLEFDKTKPARQALAQFELLTLNLAALIRQKDRRETHTAYPVYIDRSNISEFITSLPFNLTSSQNRAIEEILTDLSSDRPMHRLLEGDVGSGKTVVAAMAAYAVALNGLQTLIMAPTQILALQHHRTLSNLLKPLGVEVGLITSKLKILNSKFKVVVGTHALLSAKFNPDHVGLVIIDEQHRFGVNQRLLLSQKGRSAHVLTMTATPIPRTVALIKYGDLDLSVLTDLPPGRLAVKTWVVPESKRPSAYKWVANQLDHSQAFIVCPFIEESETQASIKAASIEFDRLKQIFTRHKLALLHGKMKPKEKETIMDEFKSKKFDVLVSTPIVEVGLDIPNANIMVIEAAERYGLASLHQLRGRVGRGGKQAYCLLFCDGNSARLKYLETNSSGPELADIDFKIRGAGDIYGQLQHGFNRFKAAVYDDLAENPRIKKQAEEILTQLDKLPVLRSLMQKVKISSV